MQRPKKRRGFVLLLVVTMLAIVCLVFYQLSHASLDYVRRVNRQERELRDRWTISSIRGCVLNDASMQFSRRELELNIQQQEGNDEAQYINEMKFECTLNGRKLVCRVADESARLSLPHLLSLKPKADVEAIVSRLQDGPHLPLADIKEDQARKQFGWCWRQVFELTPDDVPLLAQATQKITLWGDRRLNIYRADERTLVEAWRAAFGHLPPKELLDLRTTYPPADWERVRSKLDLSREKMEIADRSFSTSSSCYSLRIQAETGNQSVQRHYFICDRSLLHYGFRE